MTPQRIIPTYSMPTTNRRVLLSSRPRGIPQPTHFSLDETDIPVAAEGQFVVRNIYLSVDPAQRGWASDEANYSAPVELGTPMRALAVGVVASSRHDDFVEGQFLYGWFHWQDYCLASPHQVIRRIDPTALPLSFHAGLLGINGLTAYLALTHCGRPAAGDCALVSTAAGAVGSLVGQIARLLGCRTIGLTGSDEKVARCQNLFGYDAALNYRTADLNTALQDLAPDGINVFFDNTGGVILDTALRHMAIGGRVVQCGTAAIDHWTPPPTGLRNEREVLTRRLHWSGFVIFDHAAEFDTAARQLADWYTNGRITYEEDITPGIENAPSALSHLYAGRNLGKKLIFIG
jgi:NADPH-dependent curcumin reductase CurA